MDLNVCFHNTIIQSIYSVNKLAVSNVFHNKVFNSLTNGYIIRNNKVNYLATMFVVKKSQLLSNFCHEILSILWRFLTFLFGLRRFE
jgi:ubiquitin C-terminal hydrolase